LLAQRRRYTGTSLQRKVIYLNCQSVRRALAFNRSACRSLTRQHSDSRFLLVFKQANPTATLLQKRFAVKLHPKRSHQAHGVEP